MGLAIVGIGIGIGLVGFCSALSGIARQPEQAGAIQGAMILLAGLVEGAGIIALILCFVLGVACDPRLANNRPAFNSHGMNLCDPTSFSGC